MPEIKLPSNCINTLESKNFTDKVGGLLKFNRTKLNQLKNESKKSKDAYTNKKNSIEHKTYSMSTSHSTGNLLTKKNLNFDFKEGKIRKKFLVYDLNNTRFKSSKTELSKKSTKMDLTLSKNLFRRHYQNDYSRRNSERDAKRKRKTNKLLKYDEKLRKQFEERKDVD